MTNLSKTQLQITACTLSDSGVPTASSEASKSISAMANPSSLSRNYKINYSSDSNQCHSQSKPMGTLSPESKFVGYDAETLSFDMLFDGTGVLGQGITHFKGSVAPKVTALEAIVYNYDGKNHQPNVVKIVWGSISFFGRITSMSTKYTLFKADGTPLRAMITLSFVGYMSHETETKLANTSSPDLTHMVLVSDGDTLPLLCYRIYKDVSYYAEVAKFNGLNSTLNLKPGTSLYFPPLK